MRWIHEEKAQIPLLQLATRGSFQLKTSEEQKRVLTAAVPLGVLKESDCFANIIINLEVIYFQVPKWVF